MSLLKFKVANLSIAQDGVALQLPGQAAQMLSNQAVAGDCATVVEVLQQHATLLAGQKIRLVLSNSFVRFVVLPWREDVVNRQDWLGLAQHAFRQDYGNAAEAWTIRVSFGAYGESIIASAIDKTLYDDLIVAANQIGFKWHSIAPLAMALLTRKHTALLLIAEPQHLLLCQTAQGQWQQFSVTAPPSGQEALVAQQMIARALLPLGGMPATTQVIVAAKLSEQWRQAEVNQSAHIRTTFAKQGHKHHAGWLLTVI